MFLSAIRLRYKRPDVKRSFRVPFKNVGMWIVAMVGILAISFAFIMALVPPAQLEAQSYIKYVATLLIILFVIYSIPFVIHKFKKEEWNTLKSEDNG
jgi:amino acid transporter